MNPNEPQMTQNELQKVPNSNLTRLTEQLVMRKEQLEWVLRTIDKARLHEPEGKLRVAMSKGSPQYYLIKDSADTIGKYLRKSERKLASELAGKNYNSKLRPAIVAELEIIERLISNKSNSPESIYDNLSAPRKALISPLLLSDKVYMNMWKEETFQTNTYHPEELIYETD